jgi:uncharacterized FlaG/YvyC family protein
MSLKLNQVIAIANGEKTKLQNSLTQFYHQCEKAELFTGMARTYTPKDVDGEVIPDEKKSVQINAKDALSSVSEVIEQAYNLIGTQDLTNCSAIVDVKDDDGNVIIKQVPVTFLLFLEKQVKDLTTVINSLPILDSADEWKFSEGQNCYKTESEQAMRTKKVLKNHIKAEATIQHPAQIDVFTEDVQVGTWSKIKYSGAISKKEKDSYFTKIKILDKAIKLAREEANMIEAKPAKFGTNVVDFIFKS